MEKFSHPEGLSATQFAPLYRCFAEVVHGYREIENALLGFWEQFHRALHQFSSLAAHAPPMVSESSPLPPGGSSPLPPQESLLPWQIELYRRQSQEVAETFAQLRSLWKELLTYMKEGLQGAKLAWEHPPLSISETPTLAEPLHHLQKERDALEQQCRQLEARLAEKTQEAAHLAEMLEQHKRQIARQQEQWAKHLQMVKPLIDSLFTSFAESLSLKEMDIPSESDSPQVLSAQTENIFPFLSSRIRKEATG